MEISFCWINNIAWFIILIILVMLVILAITAYFIVKFVVTTNEKVKEKKINALEDKYEGLNIGAALDAINASGVSNVRLYDYFESKKEMYKAFAQAIVDV